MFLRKGLYSAKAWVKNNTSFSFRLGSAVAVVASSWYFAYDYLSDKIDRSSYLVRQTLFNLRNNPEVMNIIGNDLQITSRIQGFQSQSLAQADITFSIIGSKGIPADIFVAAEKSGLNWQTKKLHVVSEKIPTIILKDDTSVNKL